MMHSLPPLLTAIDDSCVPPRVRLAAETGEFWAVWYGDRPPSLGRIFVELDCHDELRWGVDIVSDPGADHRLVTGGDGTLITGTVLAAPLDPRDGPVDMQVGPCVIGLDVVNPPSGIVGTTATARVNSVTVHPVNY